MPNALCCSCLAVSGLMLLCGGVCKDRRSDFVVVLDPDSIRCQHTLRLEHDVYGLLSVERLLSMRGEVWGRLGNSCVVVFGKAERGEGSGMSEAGRA